MGRKSTHAISTWWCSLFVVLSLLLLLMAKTSSEIEKLTDDIQQRESAAVTKMIRGNEKSSKDEGNPAFFLMPGYYLYNMASNFGGTSSTHGEVSNLQVFLFSAGTVLLQSLIG